MKKISGSHNDVKLSKNEIDRIRYWIESGAAYPGTYAALGSGMIGGYSENIQTNTDWHWPATKAATEAIDRRCLNCHKENNALPRSISDERNISFWRPDMNDPRLRMIRHLVFNLSRPEKSLMLLAPLDKEAGGYGICKIKNDNDNTEKPVFPDSNDPDYQKILAMCIAGKEHLEQIDCLFGAELAKLRWIPVTERLPVLTQKIASPVPKESEEVWVSDGKQTAKAYWLGTKHWLFSDGIRLFIVTHWMPIILPEPLKDKDA